MRPKWAPRQPTHNKTNRRRIQQRWIWNHSRISLARNTTRAIKMTSATTPQTRRANHIWRMKMAAGIRITHSKWPQTIAKVPPKCQLPNIKETLMWWLQLRRRTCHTLPIRIVLIAMPTWCRTPLMPRVKLVKRCSHPWLTGVAVAILKTSTDVSKTIISNRWIP